MKHLRPSVNCSVKSYCGKTKINKKRPRLDHFLTFCPIGGTIFVKVHEHKLYMSLYMSAQITKLTLGGWVGRQSLVTS